MATLKERFLKAAKGEAALPFDPKGGDQSRLADVRIEDIQTDPTQPRKDLGDLEGLKASIQTHGIMQPIVVSPLDERRFLLIAGERRYTAAKQIGLRTIPALIRTIEDQNRLEVQLIENLHRKDLNPFEEAEGYQRLMNEFSATQTEIAEHVGKSVSVVNEMLRILDLPERIRSEFRTSENVSKSVLLEIAKQTNEADQVALWERAKNGGLTVRDARSQKSTSHGNRKPRAHRTIATSGATVKITIEGETLSDEEVIEALEEALTLQKQAREAAA